MSKKPLVCRGINRKTLSNKNVVAPYVINVDKNTAFPPAHTELLEEKLLPNNAELRQVKYLNNSVENDHKFVKSKSRYRQWYQSFNTARRTIDGMETMRMIQKGQVRYVIKGDIYAQNNFICRIFGLVA